VADLIATELRGEIAAANAKDVAAGKGAGLSDAMVDRLTLTDARIEGMAQAVREVVDLPDPVGTLSDERTRPNGIEIARMRIPLGVIGMIYEARPNVTAEAGALCLKSGNAVILRGGKEAFESNRAIAKAFERACGETGLPVDSVVLLPTTDREATNVLIRLDGLVDLVIPRGGEGLIRHVVANATVPVIQHYKGVCHVYVDGDADLDMALNIAMNAKTHRYGVCNAMETLLVDRACAKRFVPQVAAAMREAGVEVRGDASVRELDGAATAATEEDWDTEYLAPILSMAIVDGIDGAIAHVARHGSLHTEAIVTTDSAKAARWVREVDASAVVVNASTRFNDGGELGLGAEIGISTTKLHAFGPMGLEELCTRKWVVRGQGQIRT
ncbi:MAG: glutamate-5-semialdehyde dehydrogenase, partial [Myxococcales bacterium]|nr:glutamate-5-semialdehyde dehydrogenase [Myxococcales bacterium]